MPDFNAHFAHKNPSIYQALQPSLTLSDMVFRALKVTSNSKSHLFFGAIFCKNMQIHNRRFFRLYWMICYQSSCMPHIRKNV